MQIMFLPQIKYYNSNNKYNYPSFKMDMKELSPINQFIARKYKINPQEHKTLDKFYTHCKNMAHDVAIKNYFGRSHETRVQRQESLEKWYEYLTKPDNNYTGAVALMVMYGIVSELGQKDDSIPPVLYEDTLADTVKEIEDEAQIKQKALRVSFIQKYRNNSRKKIMAEENIQDEHKDGWIVIPSNEYDMDKFQANVEKIQMLSNSTWCTKNNNTAKDYLMEGDFHIYMEEGKPKLIIRFIGDEVEEIQGVLNDSRIPVEYYDIMTSYLKNYKKSSIAKKQIENLESAKAKTDQLLKIFPNGINNYSTQEILENFGIKCKKDKEGLLIISHYKADFGEYTFADLGIDENRLFNDIKIIEGDANFYGSQATSLGKLQSIGGNANFNGSEITDLGDLQAIVRSAKFKGSKITNLGKLKSIGENANFDETEITGFGELKSIGGYATFIHNVKLRQQWKEIVKRQLPDDVKNATTQEILDSLGIKYKKDKDGLFTISSYYANRGDFTLSNLGIDENKLFKDIKAIEGDADFAGSKATHLGRLQSIGGNANFSYSEIVDLGELQTIKRSAKFMNSKLKSIGKLQFIGEDANFYMTQITSLGDLWFVGGNIRLECSQITNIAKLKFVGKDVYIFMSKLKPEDFVLVKVGGKFIE